VKTTPGISFLTGAVAEAAKLEAARREERQAEGRRRELPFPDAVDPDVLVAEGRLVEITVLAARAVQDAITARGFLVPVFATPAAGEAMQRLGVEMVIAGAWWACRRGGFENGLRQSRATTCAMPFLVTGPEGAEAWLSYQFAQRPNGQVYGAIFIRDEVNPAVTSSTDGRKEATNARA
jgi:hypothetical protein